MPRSVTVSVAPAEEPVTLAQQKLHMRVDASDEDAIVSSDIIAARAWCEVHTGRAFVTRTLVMRLDAFPAGGEIELPWPPTQAVSQVRYVDTDGVLQVLDASLWTVDAAHAPARLVPAYGKDWPDTRAQPAAVEVTYTAGYGSADDVPEGIRAAVKLMAAHLFEQREPEVVGSMVSPTSVTVERLLGPYRVRGAW